MANGTDGRTLSATVPNELRRAAEFWACEVGDWQQLPCPFAVESSPHRMWYAADLQLVECPLCTLHIVTTREFTQLLWDVVEAHAA